MFFNLYVGYLYASIWILSIRQYGYQEESKALLRDRILFRGALLVRRYDLLDPTSVKSMRRTDLVDELWAYVEPLHSRRTCVGAKYQENSADLNLYEIISAKGPWRA